MKRRHEVIGAAIAGVVLIAAMGGLLAMKVSIWNECRIDHSWWYCLHLVNGR